VLQQVMTHSCITTNKIMYYAHQLSTGRPLNVPKMFFFLFLPYKPIFNIMQISVDQPSNRMTQCTITVSSRSLATCLNMEFPAFHDLIRHKVQ